MPVARPQGEARVATGTQEDRTGCCTHRTVAPCGATVSIELSTIFTDRESATRVAMEDDMIAKGFCIVGQECSRYDSDKKGRTGRTEYLYK